MSQVSLWEKTAPPALPWPELTGTQRAQVAVVGAGYTGLAAALRLAEAGKDVVVIDAQAPGWGGSGRNGGQVIAGLKHDPDTLAALFGAERGTRIASLAGAAPDVVFELIDRHGIDCAATRTGWLQLAVNARTLAAVTARVLQWQARGAPVELLTRAEAARLTGAAIYSGGALDRRGGTVQPLAYARGLAEAAAGLGARIFANAPATGLSRSGTDWRVACAGGDVLAASVIIATNAYTGRLTPALRRSVVTLPSFQIATDPLPAKLRPQILPQRQSGSDMRRLLRYFRLDAAGRLVMGARGAFGPLSPRQAIARHIGAVRDIFPQAAALEFPYQWGGLVAMTPDHLPHLHELAPGVITGLGYNGRGVAMATSVGCLLAAWAGGATVEALDLPVTKLRPMGLHRFSQLGARAAVQWYRGLDLVDRVG